MLTFQPLKTKALIIQGNITRKRRIFKCRNFIVKLPVKKASFHTNIKNRFDDVFSDSS
jgi:hypothetical protein